jgi:hypothetical protein
MGQLGFFMAAARPLALALRALRAAFTLAVLAASVPSVMAQSAAPVGTWFLVNGGTSLAKHTDVAYDTQNGVYLEVWGFTTVYGRFVAPDGTLLGTPFKIPNTTANAQMPRVAYSPDTKAFMVIWMDNRDNDNSPRVYARAFAYQPGGGVSFVGADFAISSGFVAYRTPDAIEYATGSREFLVVYAAGSGLMARRVGVDGTMLSGEFNVAPDTGDGYDFPGIGYSSTTDTFLVGWEQWYNAWDAGQVRSRTVKAGTGTLGSTMGLDATVRSLRGPVSVSYDPIRNRYLAAFYRGTSGGPTFGRFVNADGSLVGTQPFTIATTGTYISNGLAYNPLSDSYFCVFPHASTPDTYGAEVLGSGTVGSLKRITTVSATDPSVIGVDYSRIAAAADRPEWLSTANIYTSSDWHRVLGQRINATPSGSVFTKTAPANGAANQSSSVTVAWNAVTGGSYEICYDTTNDSTCSGGWQTVGSPTTAVISGLADGTYYWQVRNVNGGTTEANTGTWWSFSVGAPPALTFGKSLPGAGSSTTSPLTFTWTPAAGAASYRICFDSAADGNCSTSWTPVGNVTTYSTSLGTGTWAWQVQAYNGAYWSADGGTEWTVNITGSTSLFTKSAPSNGATGQSSPVSLSWSAAPSTSSYTVCVDTSNDSSCTASWTTVNGTSYTTGTLAAGTYYWQVRANNGTSPPPMADNGVWYSFGVGGGGGSAPGVFSKSAPANGATGQVSSPSLSWAASSGATSYLVCVDTSNNSTCDTTWQTVAGTSLSLSGQADGTYYWQVKAVNSSGQTEANSGTWWSYSVTAGGTGFAKTSPTYGTSALGSSVTLAWGAVTSASYQVCVSSTGPSCDSSWMPTATATSRVYEGLSAGTYYWQVRATVNSTITDADSGTWWAFVVGTGSAASAMGKLTPTNSTTTPTSGTLTFTWGAVAGATYEVCLDTVSNTTCDASWMPVATNSLSRTIGSLGATTYYWQVRAVVGGVRTEANSGNWWSFTIPAPPPPLFTKTTPLGGASGTATSVSVSWSPVSNASYQVCLDTTNNNACDGSWMPTASATGRTFEGLAPGTYYWQARATVGSTTTEADNGTWRSFTVVERAKVNMTAGAAPMGSWVFSEGAVGLTQGFSTYFVVANENATAAWLRGWIVNADSGVTTFYEQSVAAQTRITLNLATLVGSVAGRYSAVFQSVVPTTGSTPAGNQLYVGRTMYWSNSGGVMTGPGNTKAGVLVTDASSLSSTWYFAEGTRLSGPGGAFATSYAVFNPNQTPANVTISYYAKDGGLIESVPQTIPAQDRWTVDTSSDVNLANKDFSAVVTCTNGLGILAERSMYWGTSSSAGHVAVGSPTVGPDWYFAEGTAMSNFGTFYLLLNPNGSPVTVHATYHLSKTAGGVAQDPVLKTYTLPANSRTTLYLGEEVAGTQTGVASEFHADSSANIVIERSMYWGKNWTEGSSVMAAPTPAVEWHLPEGSTIAGFESYLLLSNPNTSEVTVAITTYSDTGSTPVTQTTTIPPQTRLTLWMNNQTAADGLVFSNIAAKTFSTRVVGTLPIVAEQAVYWNRLNVAGEYWRGGDATMGTPVIR